MSGWPVIEWDDCYPTDESIDAAERFLKEDSLDFHGAAAWLLTELPKCAANCCASCEVTDSTDILDHPVKRIEFSTGGWSGAEEIMGLIESRFDLRHFMFSWQRGGHYVFEVPPHFLTPAPTTPREGDER